MKYEISIPLKNEAATLALGETLAKALPNPPFVCHLIGNLGAGKTTFVRGVLRGLGYKGAVKSPTYTIVEPYEIKGQKLYHFDLYRIVDPEELELIGFRDYLEAISFIEWPERAEDLPEPDLNIYLEIDGTERIAHFQMSQKIHETLAYQAFFDQSS